jgi:2-polyprenyl-6-methoxyphenol hydroxylase-like FAD-dependent oxidoreductase
LADRVGAAKREARFVGAAVPNYFRRPYGPGWTLVGDAGYNKDFITAQGIQDAFRDAELCATALAETLSGARSFDAAMEEYQSTRDEHVLPMYEFTTQLATLEPPPPELQQLLGAVHGSQEAMDGFARVNAGVTSPAEFFSEANVEHIFASAGERLAS